MATFNQSLPFQIQLEHPNLRAAGYKITSDATPVYNCIAWAAEDIMCWWWPDSMKQAYWPKGVERKETIPAFKAAYETVGYEVCSDGELVKGAEKIAVYVDRQGVPTHAARQLADGQWTSKLGRWHDLSHTLSGLEDNTYGTVSLFMQRKLKK